MTAEELLAAIERRVGARLRSIHDIETADMLASGANTLKQERCPQTGYPCYSTDCRADWCGWRGGPPPRVQPAPLEPAREEKKPLTHADMLTPQQLVWYKGRQAAVIELCEHLGFGFVIHEAFDAWERVQPGTAHRPGPCSVFTEPCEHPSNNGDIVGCSDCFGCGWQFVKEEP